MPPDTPAFTPLPAIGSDARRNMIVAMAAAFGPPNGPGALNPQAIYNQLSQLSYHDRITLLRAVCQHQGSNALERLHPDPEVAVRRMLLNGLGHGTDGRPTFAGVNRFLHLIADAPQDQRYTNMLAAEVTIIRFDMCVAGFTDATPGSEIAGARDAFMHYRNETPTQRLAAIGITLGSPPFRQPALPIAPAPAYRALPAINTDARRDLVAQLVTAAGPLTTSGGFQNPEAFFRLMANYNYANRIALYREVLRAQGFTTAADAPEHMVRRILMINFVTNSAGQKSFAGLERYFRMVSDAPRDTTYRNYLTGEFRHLIELGYPAQFIDRNQPGIQANYQRLFSIGGNNPNLLPSDPYSRLELIGVPLGRPPVLNPALPARGRFSTAPILWDRLDLAPEPLHRTRGLALAMQGDTARDSVTPVSLSLDGLEQTHYSPLAHV